MVDLTRDTGGRTPGHAQQTRSVPGYNRKPSGTNGRSGAPAPKQHRPEAEADHGPGEAA